MKLQFAWNPVKGKKRKKPKSKKVAKRHKKAKTKGVKSKHSKAGKSMAKKKATKRKLAKRSVGKVRRKKKNPEAALVKKGGKIVARPFSKLSKSEFSRDKGLWTQAMAAYKKSAPASAERSAAYKTMLKLSKGIRDREAYLKTLARYEEEGAQIKTWDLKKKGSSVAKKKKKGGKKKATKKKAAKKAAKKVAKSSKKKSSKKKSAKRRSKAQKAATRKLVAANKARKKSSKKRKGSKKKRKSTKRHARMITHRHGKSMRHVRKGSSFPFKVSKKRKGKRPGYSVSGRIKFNPFKNWRNPMNLKKITGLEKREIQLLAVGAAAAPLATAALKHVPVLNKLPSLISQYVPVPVQYQSALGNLILGAAVNAGADYAPGQAKKYLGMAGEGLMAAAIIGIVSNGVSDLLKMGGLSGVNYTPSMRGVNYTPSMRGMGIVPQLNGMGDVRFTPSMRGMGQGADFGSADYGGNGGYTQSHKFSRADFGANFSEDSEAEGLADEDNSYSSSMN